MKYDTRLTGWGRFVIEARTHTHTHKTKAFVRESSPTGTAGRRRRLTAELLSPHRFLLLRRHLQGGGPEVGHDHEELLEADLVAGARLAPVLVPGPRRQDIQVSPLWNKVQAVGLFIGPVSPQLAELQIAGKTLCLAQPSCMWIA